MKIRKKLMLIVIALLLFISSQTCIAVAANENTKESKTKTEVVEEKKENEQQKEEDSTSEETTKITEKKDENKRKIDDYTEKYGSESYGMTAFVLDKVRWYSIPFCFIGIVVGALYQYVLGTRRLDMKHKGFGLMIAATTIFVICQVLPLIFTVVVIGWRG